jgi:pimeloyl-ACP methyl ester carboxylesterase
MPATCGRRRKSSAPWREASVTPTSSPSKTATDSWPVNIPGGLRHVYLQGGHGDPLLLLHGFGANKDNFTQLAGYLTPHYRVIAPDHIGFGESSHSEDVDYSPASQAARVPLSCGRLASRGFTLARRQSLPVHRIRQGHRAVLAAAAELRAV